MTNVEIITQLEDLARDTKGRIDPEDPVDVFQKDYEALTEAVRTLKGGKKKMDEYIKKERLKSAISAEDVTPIRHGKWVHGEDVDIQCSICGCDALTKGDYRQIKSNFCPNCGARMDLEELEALKYADD